MGLMIVSFHCSLDLHLPFVSRPFSCCRRFNRLCATRATHAAPATTAAAAVPAGAQRMAVVTAYTESDGVLVRI